MSSFRQSTTFRLILAGVIACGTATAQERGAQTAVGSASIAGRVLVEGPARQPARQLRVTLTNVAHTSSDQVTTTDNNGAFTFSNIPEGRFELRAYKAGYLVSSYGAIKPERPGNPIVVKNGAAIANLTMFIARGGVITGVVRDVRGHPAPGVSVRVLRFGYATLNGERSLSAPTGSNPVTSDDRGQYRIYGLPPGSYLVLANATSASGRSRGSGVEAIRPLTSAEVARALQAARSGGASGSVVPSVPPPLAVPVNYVPTFYPGVTDVGAASTVVLGLSEERGGADITVQLVPASTVSGVVKPPPGDIKPTALRVTLVPAAFPTELLSGAGLRAASAQPGPDGAFAFAGLAPGRYTVKASTNQGGRGSTTPSGPALWAATEVVVTGSDVNVTLTLQRGVDITGRAVFEGAQPTADELQALALRLVPVGSGGAALTIDYGGRVDATGRFEFTGITPDLYQFASQWSNPTASSRWILKASVANGRESFDTPLRVEPSESVEWTLTFTDRPAVVTGMFQDRNGRPATDYFIVVFSSDRKFWAPGSRRVGATRPATDGSYSLKGLPAGDYQLGAATDLQPGEWNDPALLEDLFPFSVKLTIREGETTRQDLRIGGLLAISAGEHIGGRSKRAETRRKNAQAAREWNPESLPGPRQLATG